MGGRVVRVKYWVEVTTGNTLLIDREGGMLSCRETWHGFVTVEKFNGDLSMQPPVEFTNCQ